MNVDMLALDASNSKYTYWTTQITRPFSIHSIRTTNTKLNLSIRIYIQIQIESSLSHNTNNHNDVLHLIQNSYKMNEWWRKCPSAKRVCVLFTIVFTKCNLNASMCVCSTLYINIATTNWIFGHFNSAHWDF